MQSNRRSLLGLLAAGAAAVFLPSREVAKAQQTVPSAGPGLVGAWLVSSSRSTGEGVVLLTFTSDGTFFRSGDTHPVLSVAHGVWTQVGDGEFEASYIALRFDENRAHIGSQTTRIHITVGANPDEFTGLTRGRILGL